MFEQSLLVGPRGGRKTVTFAASLTAQILVAGVLITAPLFHHDGLPSWRLPEAVLPLVMWRPPETRVTRRPTGARSSRLAVAGVFIPPRVIRSDYPVSGMIVLDYDSSMLPTTSSIAALPVGSSPTLPRFEPASAAATKPEGAPVSAGPVSVGGDVQAAKLLKRVIPLYPKTAVQLRISGIVHLLGIIGKDGTIQKLQVLSGHPLLRQAALDAVSQWVYRPTILNGQPVEVEAPVDVVFTLSQ